MQPLQPISTEEDEKRTYWTRLANFAAFSTLGLAIACATFAVWRWYGQDFITYYVAARLILANQNPYDYRLVVPIVYETIGIGGQAAYLYAPWWVYPLLPLASLPFQIARAIWIIVNVLFWISSMLLIEQVLHLQLVPWKRWLTWLATFLLFSWFTLRTEQAAITVLLTGAILLWALARGHGKIAVVASAWLFSKPNITVLPIVLIVVGLWQRNRRLLVGVILVLVSLAALASVVTPGWWEPIINGQVPPAWDHGLVGLEVEGRRVNSTMMDWLEITWGIQGIPALSILAIVACIGVFSLWRWRSHPLFVAILSVPIGFLLAPTAMQYDYALLTIPFMWVLGRVAHISRIRQAIIAACIAGFFSLLFLESLVSDALWFPIVLTLLVLIAAPSVTSRQSAIS